MFTEKAAADLPLRTYAAGPDTSLASDLPHVLQTLTFACAAMLVSYFALLRSQRRAGYDRREHEGEYQ